MQIIKAYIRGKHKNEKTQAQMSMSNGEPANESTNLIMQF